MTRLIVHFVVAALCFGAGWLVANTTWAGLQPQKVFRLSVDAPTGETRIKCEGCQFLTWIDGRAGEPEPAVIFTCSDGPCWTQVGAITVTPQPKLMAQSNAEVD
jgi:hypothetical protein